VGSSLGLAGRNADGVSGSSLVGVPKRRDPAAVSAAVERVLSGTYERAHLALAVRALAEQLADQAPGGHVEVRVPPYAAVQCGQGPRHTRGTPPNVVEADPVVFVELCAGRVGWDEAVADGRIRTWGDRADLSPWVPLVP
jgi:hypothetical protein